MFTRLISKRAGQPCRPARRIGQVMALAGAALICFATWNHPQPVTAQPPEPPEPPEPAADLPLPEEEVERELLELEQLLAQPLGAPAPALEQQVTSVSRQESTVGRSAAAVFVITQEDIRRSGYRSIPEILRMAPGVNVARLESNVWGVSIRGFNDEFANKLLVLVDGREVYTPAFGGVHWDVVDTMIEDIERIEVIRGPGGTIWGNNAVNGVINIITKKAEDTQGVLVNGGAGTEQRAFGGVRVGGRIDENTHYRVYTKGFDRDQSTVAGIPDTNDDWRQGRLGFRIDQQSCCDWLTLQGDVYSGNHGHFESANLTIPGLTIPPDRDDVYGGDMLARWTHEISDDSDWSLQVYYDYQDRKLDNVHSPFERRQGLFDVDFQHRFPLGEFHKIIWGASYRFSHDKFVNQPDLVPPSLSFDPASLIYHTYSCFLQDEIELLEDRLYFTAGSKFSWNHFSNFEAQPSGRLSWIPANRFMTWASVSRAVRIPTRADDAGVASFGAIPASLPNRDLPSEEVVAYELGWRYAPNDCFFLDVAVFFNDYDDLRTSERIGGLTVRDSKMFGETYGFEVASTAQMTDSWSIKLAYSYLQSQLHLDPDSTDVGSGIRIPSELAGEGGSPHNQVYARSSWDLGCNWQFDLALRYVDNLPVVSIPAYLESDARLAWRPCRNLELSVVGQNLFDGSHREFAGQVLRFATGTEVERSVYGMVQYEY